MSAQLPVFVFPHALSFTRQNRVQTLTIYNPYDFALKYSVLCTTPQSFSVSGSDGTIRARCCLDIVIRLLESEPRDAYFQVITHEVTQSGQMPRSGRRQLSVTIATHEPLDKSQSEELPFKPLTSSPPTSSPVLQTRQYELTRSSPRTNITLFYAIGVLCVIILSLPSLPIVTEGDSYLPEWCHLSISVKLVAAYVLGIVTVAIIRT